MKPNQRMIFVILLGFYSVAAYAGETTISPDSINGFLVEALGRSANKVLGHAMTLFGTFMLLQSVITNFGLLKNGADIEAVFGKLIGSLLWFGFCVFIIQNGPMWIQDVGNELFSKFAPDVPSPGGIITTTVAITGVLVAAAVAVGLPSGTAGILMIVILIIVFAVGMLFAIKIFMLELEVALIVMLAPLSFSFLGLNALKDQGIAPFKSLISIAYRIILLGIVAGAFGKVGEVLKEVIINLMASITPVPNPLTFIDVIKNSILAIFSALGSYCILGYLLFKSDSIASSLAGGSSNMGSGDLASAAAAGAAAGAAITSAGASAAGAAASGGQSMGSFLSGLTGSPGSVSNASGSGIGTTPVGTAPINPNISMNSGTQNGSAPVRPEVSSGNLPIRPSETPTVGESPSPNALGSGTNAGIEGGASMSEQKLDKVLDALTQGNKKSMGDHLQQVNEHIAQEKATTMVSVSTHNTD